MRNLRRSLHLTRTDRPRPSGALFLRPAALLALALATAAGPARAQRAESSPAAAMHPALFIVGDSTTRTGTGKGESGPWGWGDEIGALFDPARIHVYNQGLGGRSSRGYREEGAWKAVLQRLQPGDFVIIQFGHNDSANSANYPDRTTLPGAGDGTGQIESPVTHRPETLHTYGWYLRQYVKEAQGRGARVILCSPVPRNTWIGGRIKRGFDGYALWARQAAAQSGAFFVDLNAIAADRYDTLGQARAAACFHDYQHTVKAGARINAESVAAGLRGLGDCPLAGDLAEPRVDRVMTPGA